MSLKAKFPAILIAITGLCLGTGTKAIAAAGCSVASTAATFNVYNTMSASPNTSTATITVTCQAAIQLLVGYTISLSAGSSGTVTARAMLSGASPMSYQLYQDPVYSIIWGDGTGSSQTLTDGYLLAVLTPVARSYTVYGRIPALQNLTPGTYIDTINVVITY